MRLVVALLLALTLVAVAAAAQAPAPSLLMISIDGLRPDYVTAADTHGIKIPALRRLVTEGAFAEGVHGVIQTVLYPSKTTRIIGQSPADHIDLSMTLFHPLRTHQTAWSWYEEDMH